MPLFPLSFSLPGLPAHELAVATLLLSLLFLARCVGHARRHLNAAFDPSPSEETIVAVLHDPGDEARRLLVPLELDEAGPVAVEAPFLPGGEKAVLRWREGFLKRAYAETLLPTDLPVEAEEVASALEVCGVRDDLAEIASRDARTMPELAVDPAAFHPLPLPAAGHGTFGGLLVHALGAAAAFALALSAANIAFDRSAPVNMVAKIIPRTDGDAPLRTVRVRGSGGGEFPTLVPAPLVDPAAADRTFAVRRREGFFRAPWIETWAAARPADAVAESPAAPAPKADAPFRPPSPEAATALLRHAFAAERREPARALVENLLEAGDLPLALALAESYAERFPDDPMFLAAAMHAAALLGENTHADLLCARGASRFPDDAKFRATRR